jgi:hypothetical protein
MFMYIAEVYGKVKPGISKTVTSRILSYDKGNTNPVIHKLYVANEGFDSHINNLEAYVLRELFPYLENPNGNRTPSEYVDPKFTQINVSHVQTLIETRIKNHPLQIRKLKDDYLPITRHNAKAIIEGITLFPDKYLEDI